MFQNCPYCRESIVGTSQRTCPTCHTPHHLDCWNENGGCTVYGCFSAPPEDLTDPPPAVPPAVPPVGYDLPPSTHEHAHLSGRFFTEFLRDRRILVRNLLFVGFLAMPVGALAGALLGLGLGFIYAIFGGGAGSIFSFPINGMCGGQALGVVIGVILAAILGESFVSLFRQNTQALVMFVFEGVDIGLPAKKTKKHLNKSL